MSYVMRGCCKAVCQGSFKSELHQSWLSLPRFLFPLNQQDFLFQPPLPINKLLHSHPTLNYNTPLPLPMPTFQGRGNRPNFFKKKKMTCYLFSSARDQTQSLCVLGRYSPTELHHLWLQLLRLEHGPYTCQANAPLQSDLNFHYFLFPLFFDTRSRYADQPDLELVIFPFQPLKATMELSHKNPPLAGLWPLSLTPRWLYSGPSSLPSEPAP